MLDILIGVIPNIIYAGIAAAAAWVWQQRKIRKLKERLNTLSGPRGEREAALQISAREDITEAVRAQLNHDNRSDLPLYKVHKEGNFTDQESDWMDFVHRLKDEVKQIREHNITRVYLFTNVPVVMGVFIGALLDNGPEVIVHHFFGGVYRRIGSMTHETVYGP